MFSSKFDQSSPARTNTKLDDEEVDLMYSSGFDD
jgi:hypothetical protein